MKKNNFKSIDLVIVNFYPFKETLKKTSQPQKIIENIDIGGPSLVRAAAKNFNEVTVITDKFDYKEFIYEMNKYKGKTSAKFRERLASKAFGFTAYYDSVISEWYNQRLGIEFPNKKTFFGERISQLRYGENPHQKSCLYISDLWSHKTNLDQLSGKDLSFNNYNDIYASLEILLSETNLASTVIVKHANPCGVASNKSSFQSFIDAQASDPVSAFGGVVACNFKISKKVALEINKTFF